MLRTTTFLVPTLKAWASRRRISSLYYAMKDQSKYNPSHRYMDRCREGNSSWFRNDVMFSRQFLSKGLSCWQNRCILFRAPVGKVDSGHKFATHLAVIFWNMHTNLAHSEKTSVTLSFEKIASFVGLLRTSRYTYHFYMFGKSPFYINESRVAQRGMEVSILFRLVLRLLYLTYCGWILYISHESAKCSQCLGTCSSVHEIPKALCSMLW